MLLLVVFLPLFGFISGAFFGRYIGRQGVAFLTTFLMIITTCLSYFLFYDVALSGNVYTLELISWIDLGIFSINWGFLFDPLTVVMLITVTTVSTLVHLYSTEYMGEDPHFQRFMSYLSLFTFFMLILVTADNYLQMFVGWEGVGLASYLLINFWHTRIQANKSALKAMILNRIGDFSLLLGILLVYFLHGSLEYSVIFSEISIILENNYTINIFGNTYNPYNVIGLFFLFGAVGKSAQIGLHAWLPDAMEGPTPVSALIHAATMVTAGVFLMVRSSPLLEYAPTALYYTALFGGITAFFAGTIGLFQNDLKKVIAYSTCSQLGYMMFAAGLSQYHFSIYYLVNHAFLKALLFLGAGAIIHSFGGEQDIRKMGGLINLLPFTYVMMVIGSLSLMGIPFMTGFYSKDGLLEAVYTLSLNNINIFIYLLGLSSVFTTAYYSIRLLVLVFFKKPRGHRITYNHVIESGLPIYISLTVLAFGSIFVGFILKDMMVGPGSDFWGISILLLTNHSNYDMESMLFFEKFLPFVLTVIAVMLAIHNRNIKKFIN
uniref:NADH-ubiquinone oxidoreductase chain 5 n=1 Tax=Colponema vietnamica TaxID=1492817 RepID=V5KVD9_9ALVE|nr:NADH dehydrogenase subunit 5a [Colponema vietnamica]ATY40846.1 NADH dehydrogenase subunit 5a [Colponema vietnamica]